MSNVYDKELREKLLSAAEAEKLPLRQGVYMMFQPARATRRPPRSASRAQSEPTRFGMSTVPEAIAAAHCGIRTVGISCITNLAAGILDRPLNHQEVIETAARAKQRFNRCARPAV